MKRTLSRGQFGAAAGATALFSLGQTARSMAAEGTVTLGVPLPLSGNASAWGQQAQAALQVAEADINKKGGVRLSILIKDDGSDPNQTVSVVRQLITGDRVAAILGPFLSSQATVTIPLAKREQVPFIEPSAAVPNLLEPARPWAVRLALIGDNANSGPFSLWLKRRNIKRIVFGYENSNPATKDAGTRQYTRGAKMAGVTIVNEDAPVTWTVDMTDFSAVVTKIRGFRDADALALAPGNEAPLLAKELKRQGSTLPVWSGNVFGDDASLITRGGDAVEGWVGVSQNWSGSPDPQVENFVSKFKAALNKETGKQESPNTYAFNFYYATMATADVLRKAKVDSARGLEAVRQSIMDGWNHLKNYKLMQGQITIGADGEARRPLFILEVQKGRWVLLDTYNPA